MTEDLKYAWFDASAGFACPCGEAEIIVDNQCEPRPCPRCGVVWRMVAYVERVEKEGGSESA